MITTPRSTTNCVCDPGLQLATDTVVVALALHQQYNAASCKPSSGRCRHEQMGFTTLSTAAVDEFEPRKVCRRWKSVVASSLNPLREHGLNWDGLEVLRVNKGCDIHFRSLHEAVEKSRDIGIRR